MSRLAWLSRPVASQRDGRCAVRFPGNRFPHSYPCTRTSPCAPGECLDDDGLICPRLPATRKEIIMTTTETPATPIPTALELAVLIQQQIPRWSLYEDHFTSLASSVRHTQDGVQIVIDVTLDYFADAPPVHFVLPVSEPELVRVEGGVEVGVSA